MHACLWFSLFAFGAILAGCQSAPAEPIDRSPALVSAPADFSGDAAFAHLRALAAIGPRAAGTAGAAEARAYLRAELEKLGLVVEERRVAGPLGPDGAPLEIVNLVAVIPGDSPQLFVLAAPYDTRRFERFRFVGANAGASGPALLLELARVIQAKPLRYTTSIVFLDGEAAGVAGETADAAPLLAGSNAIARELLIEAGGRQVRFIGLFEQVGDADLLVARDLRSHRLFREEFWLAATRLGYSDAFRPDDPFASPPGSHQAFIAAGFRHVVLITDPAHGGSEPPGAFANSEDDTPERCSPQSLASVGSVTIEALDRIGARLAKIDRFAKPPPSPAPVPSEAPAQTEVSTTAPAPPVDASAPIPPVPLAPSPESSAPAPAPPTEP